MKKLIVLFLILINIINFAQEKSTIRLAVYNLKQYSKVSKASNEIKKVIELIKPTIFLAVELDGTTAVNDLLTNSFNAKYKASTEVKILWGNGNECAVFYMDSLVTYLGSTMYSADTRPIAEFKFVTKDLRDTLIIFGVHLKAYPEETARRLAAVNVLRSRTELYGNNKNMIVAGDFNIFTSEEPAFQKMIDQSTPGYFIDMTGAKGSWNNNPSLSSVCTYSSTSLNTRLDMILISSALKEKGGIDYVDDSFKIFGNDGNHYGKSMANTFNAWFPSDATIGTALTTASDHLPIFADFQIGVPTGIYNYETIPASFELKQNYPNPFNPETTISYQLSGDSKVILKIYDMLGREVAKLVDEFQKAGIHNTKFSVLNSSLSSGIYFYTLTANGNAQSKKMILLR